MKSFLSGEGYETGTAPDGEEGLAKIQKGGWNLILLDIMLPKKDGLQVLKDLKIKPATSANGPIVVLTNLGNEAIINQAFTLGSQGYLIKSSMSPDEILNEIHGFLSKK